LSSTIDSVALNFTKMHGAGNDFVVIDQRHAQFPIGPALARNLADRHSGVGFDQLMLIEAPRYSPSIAAYRIINTDGSEARQCGNGARCIVAWLARDLGLAAGAYQLDGPVGPVTAVINSSGEITVELAVPEFRHERVPFLGMGNGDPQRLALANESVEIGVVAIGNPHAVVAVDDVEMAPVAQLGPAIENHPAFPDRVNVGFAQLLDRSRLRLRVHERGVGETLACGSGACASVAVMARRGLVDHSVAVELPGGTLHVQWDGRGPIRLSGPTTFVFEGTLSQ
jgi:diaminopimelate epimerase